MKKTHIIRGESRKKVLMLLKKSVSHTGQSQDSASSNVLNLD